MRLEVPKELADEFTANYPGIAIHKLELKDPKKRLLLLTICGKPEAFIAEGQLVPPMQYARTTGSAKVHGSTGATWQRAGMFFAELQSSPEIRRTMWKILWEATMERVDPVINPPKPSASAPRRRDPFWQDEPRVYGPPDPTENWFDSSGRDVWG